MGIAVHVTSKCEHFFTGSVFFIGTFEWQWCVYFVAAASKFLDSFLAARPTCTPGGLHVRTV